MVGRKVRFDTEMLEVCVDSVESARNAESGGASRIELCSNLVEGGTTPSVGMLRVIKQLVSIPVFVMIRPRGGDFLYSEQEFEVMKMDVECLKQNGANGVVIGVLNRDGSVDLQRCQELIDLARPLRVTFHRAIDMTSNILDSLEIIIRLGCERVLTSGGENTALEGAPVIRKLIEQADGRIIIVPGGGITERNLRRVLDETGARELHASARTSQPSLMDFQYQGVSMGASYGPAEFSVKVTNRDRVKNMVAIGKVAM